MRRSSRRDLWAFGFAGLGISCLWADSPPTRERWSQLRPLSVSSQLSTAFPSEKRVKTISGQNGRLAGRRVGSAEGHADGDHVAFRHDGLDLGVDVGELLVKAGECLLHSLRPAPDPGVRVEFVLCGVQLVGQIQALPIDDLVEDAPQDGLVVCGSHGLSSLLDGSWRVPR